MSYLVEAAYSSMLHVDIKREQLNRIFLFQEIDYLVLELFS